jgi:hypothetical protein
MPRIPKKQRQLQDVRSGLRRPRGREMRIRTLMEARRAIADCQQQNVLLPAEFEVARSDWYEILEVLTIGEPVSIYEPKIMGIPIVVTEDEWSE